MDRARDASTRLRRTFQYNDDAHDSDSEPEAMDEEEQESLIQRLAAENASRDASFANILIALPVAAVLPYIPALLRPRTRLLALLSITSLLSTAFLLRQLPPTTTGIAFLDNLQKSKKKPTRRGQTPDALLHTSRSPLETYLPYLNLGLVVMLLVLGFVARSEAGDLASFGIISMGNLPAVVYAVVVISKLVMGSVDPESELEGLKYDYKGA